MFKNIQSFYQWIETVSTAILGLFSGFLINEIQVDFTRKWILIVIAVALIVIAEKLIHLFFISLINNSIKVRKIILRSHFIEGKWLGVLRNTGNNSDVLGYSSLTILHQESSYEVLGKIFYPSKGQFVGGFRSNNSRYLNEEREFTYYFEGFNQHDKKSDTIIGKASLSVTLIDSFPKEMMGSMVDTKNMSELNLELYRIDDELLKKHNPDKKDGIKKIITELF